MTLWMDRLHGVWSFDNTEAEYGSHPWILVAKTNHFDHRDFMIGSGQNHASVKFLAPFKEVSTGNTFEFPVEYLEGNKVWVDETWFQSQGTLRATAWDSLNDRIGGVVTEAAGPDGFLKVSFELHVPYDRLTNRC